MTIRSLGYRTDLFFFRADAVVEDRGGFLVVRSPDNPTYYWGNFLLLDGAPRKGDLERWRTLFAREFPESGHVALGWDDPEGTLGEIQPFLDAGFVLENHVATRGEEHEEASYRVYAAGKIRMYRKLLAEGRGLWFGAFIDGRLAGDLGLFVFEGVGRFQTVGTHPDFRRRGVCGTLVYEAALQGLREMGAETLVMVADAQGHAAAIYESVGFAPTERQVGLTLRPG